MMANDLKRGGMNHGEEKITDAMKATMPTVMSCFRYLLNSPISSVALKKELFMEVLVVSVGLGSRSNISDTFCKKQE